MRKTSRKVLVGTLSAAVVASIVAPVAHAFSFKDVSEDSDHAKAITSLTERGIIKGFSDGTYQPYQEITRGQVAKIFSRLLNGEGKKESVFSDVPVDYKDQELVIAASELYHKGIMTGSNGKMMPNKPITRQQMAKVLVEALNLQPSTAYPNNLQDLDYVPSNMRKYVLTLVQNGVTRVDDGLYRPSEAVTRAQFASFVYRALEVGESREEDFEVNEAIENEEQVLLTFSKPVEGTSVAKEDFSVEGSHPVKVEGEGNKVILTLDSSTNNEKADTVDIIGPISSDSGELLSNVTIKVK
ncbi:S-layer homology domain-containing protein [Priestia filamentosa]|uniref:S-layer homology domain-containing protein n=1 Tax=Priestia filamentosa TaxID=1402861 RepID=UPI000A4E56E9|nr:S-layer homology domain-containing protein [Priestia filamentosa]WCM15644.1 S-layer homology domain-containing protein [Priestia filamentosa]